jgi:hypothetical protein
MTVTDLKRSSNQRANGGRSRVLRWLIPLGLLIAGCHGRQTLFEKIPSSSSGIHFINEITENDSINPLDLEYMYNGGGVAVGDFNNDGLQDLYFTGNMVGNRLYLNKGNFTFQDVTAVAKVAGEGRWCYGVTVIDINNDGLPDIYVCTTIKKDPAQRKNLLYINQGMDKNGIPVFKEMAAEYGLADTSFSVQAAFFDYDTDGDLDMYLLVTKTASRDAGQFSSNNSFADSSDADKLYRNDWSDSLKHPVFTDVSKQAGIIHPGYGLGVSIADINQDGWKDIYVSNDFYSSDQLYINNRNGTFSNKVKEYFRHTSQNAMGNDVADINNDGLPDLLTVDMDPADNLRKKKNMGAGNYSVYQNMVAGRYMLQYVRNTLQLNQGPTVKGNDSIGDPVFSDISFYAGVAETDWSWNPSIADFDNDGNRDILITNGYPRDVTDHDFGAFRRTASAGTSKKELIAQIPQIKIPNSAFRNTGDLHFENTTIPWGLEEPSFSNGAVYADLDNDGDLDYVISNINDEASVYENTSIEKNRDNKNAGFLDIQFRGDSLNRNGLGAFAEIFYGRGQQQVYENFPVHGYLSSVEPKAHFGLGSIGSVDSVIIKWPDLKEQVLRHVRVNHVLHADIRQAREPYSFAVSPLAKNTVFIDVTASKGVQYVHREMDYIDFDVEKLLPHKLSQYGPALAADDVDGNGLDDIVIGGNRDFPGKLLLQQPDGRFREKEFSPLTGKNIRKPENGGILLFDADGDGDPDLYCSSGSNQFISNALNYRDLFFVNGGKGNFTLDTAALPLNDISKSCVRAFDFDGDGDLDLFVGGRVMPGNYPKPVSSFIYRNDSKPGKIKFTDVTASVAKDLEQAGMVCDAVCTDFDNDGWTDLILAGEWMPITFLRNNHGKFEQVNAHSGIGTETGWWNSIAAGDFDNDGDIDYIAGNLGLNSFYRADDKHPVSIYAKDFDRNNSLDAIVTVFLPGETGSLQEFPGLSRDDIVKQLPGLRKKFPGYAAFGRAGITDLFSKEELQDALVYHANQFASCYLENLGQGRFRLHPLPPMAQLAPLYGMAVDDFNQDGNLDVALCGNDFGTEVANGRYDALNGLLLLGDGKGNFSPQTILQSGLYIPGDAKALVKLRGAGNQYLLAASQNRGPLKIFRNKPTRKLLPLEAGDRLVLYTLKNGKTRREELYYGSSFLSQSARFITMDSSIQKIEIVNNKGIKRSIIPFGK